MSNKMPKIYKILVVENSQTSSTMIMNSLQGHQFEIAMANNGVEAIAQAEVMQPDAVITDIIMPGMNGYELCRKLRKHPPTENINIIICSRKSTKADRHWGFKQGANAYINKPFVVTDLVDTIKELLKGRSHLLVDNSWALLDRIKL